MKKAAVKGGEAQLTGPREEADLPGSTNALTYQDGGGLQGPPSSMSSVSGPASSALWARLRFRPVHNLNYVQIAGRTDNYECIQAVRFDFQV